EAGRSTTSPAAIWFATFDSRIRITGIRFALPRLREQHLLTARIRDAEGLYSRQGLLELGDVADGVPGIHHRHGRDPDDQPRQRRTDHGHLAAERVGDRRDLLPGVDDLTRAHDDVGDPPLHGPHPFRPLHHDAETRLAPRVLRHPEGHENVAHAGHAARAAFP